MAEDKKEAMNKVVGMIKKYGLPIDAIIGNIGLNVSSLKLPSHTLKKFRDLFDKINLGDFTQGEKGKILEDLVATLFVDGYPNIFEVRRNCKTSSNEIDL